MSRFEPSNPRFSVRNGSKSQAEPNENSNTANSNGSDTAAFNPAPAPAPQFPPPRTPLNAIADPSHATSEALFRGLSRRFSLSSSERKLPAAARSGPEPSSAQSTPSKNGYRFSLGGANCASLNGVRALPSSSRVLRAISVSDSEFLESPAHFELKDDSSFWTDHNVQVLIRIRPPSAIERISQGHGRCLRQESGQSLIWLGHPETRFTFDHVACETISQESLFRVAGLPMVENCLSGYNSCMFAYGQTGSGKTYTMMGNIYEIEGMLNEDCGLTPRIFEYLFTRIVTEEENRKDEQLKYSCKCSFLEIYNEHITDLLEPSSTNLQLREDLKKGVHVENLTEYRVRNVNDVVKLLLQGAANRKVAATHMNSESSRSHSVFTCTIESRWGKDSMSHLRFARLNLVDLAGSERQKSSGAEGDRLKEAANINKSLSTLGLVIMSLVDLAHGKHRHVPYRDSRLTFLLQDSLGGNSKTTVIANISPSICSANETLSTLKFAQRAKLIQNNAKVNEDTSGDINALQQQIQELKGQLSYLTTNANLLRSSPSHVPNSDDSELANLPEEHGFLGIKMKTDDHVIQHLQDKITHLEANLTGALRREKLAETSLLKLEAQLEQTNCLARQREEDLRHAKMIIKLREKEIKRLESLKDGVLSSGKYLVEENKALLEEIQILQSGQDKNLALNQYAVENCQLRQQLQHFQNFHEQGERELLLAEVSDLRNQLLDMQEGKIRLLTNTDSQMQENYSAKDFEDCRIMNSKLIREVEELHQELRRNLNCSQTATDSVTDSFSKGSEVFRQADEYLLLESRSMQSDAGDEHINDEALHEHMDKNVNSVPTASSILSEDEFMDARVLIESDDSELALSGTKRRNTQEKCERYREIFGSRDMFEEQRALKLENRISLPIDFDGQIKGLDEERREESCRIVLQAKLDRMTKDLEEVRLINSQFQEKQELQLSCLQEAELVREQVEVETARTILQLQEEVASLQCYLDENLGSMAQENAQLKKIIAMKDEEVKAVNFEWERATLELTGFLVDGSKSLRNMSSQIESIACSFPETSVSISNHVERAVKTYMEKEETILQLKRSLEEAQSMVIDMGEKLSSLKGVTLALTEQQYPNEDEIPKEHETMLLSDKINMLGDKLKLSKEQVIKLEKCASVAFILINWLFDRKKVAQDDTVSLEAHSSQKFEDQHDILYHISDGITKANCRLKAIEGFVHAELIFSECSSTYRGQVDGDAWSLDYSSSSSDFSSGSVASGKTVNDSSCSGGCLSPENISKNLKVKGSMSLPHHQHSERGNMLSRNLSSGEAASNILKVELKTLFDDFNILNVQLATLVDGLNSRHFSDLKGSKQPIRPSDSAMEKANFGSRISQMVGDNENVEEANSFLKKFEQVHATVEEADSMLNALVEANENSKQLSGMWKRTGEELMLEQASLMEEVECLKSSINEKEKENRLLHEQAGFSLQDIASSISSLEDSYAQLKMDKEKLATMFSDVFSLGNEMLQFIRNSRSLLEDIHSKIVEKDFSSFVLFQCYLGELIKRVPCEAAEDGFHLFRHMNKLQFDGPNGRTEMIVNGTGFNEDGVQRVENKTADSVSLPDDSVVYESLALKELKRKEELLSGLLFDFSLLQESTSNTKDIKDETEKLVLTLSQVRLELKMKTRQYDELVVQCKRLESDLADTKDALELSNSDLAHSTDAVEVLSEQNAEFRVLIKDLYLKKTEVEEQLEEQKELVKSLEEEILQLSSSGEKKFLLLVEDIEDNLHNVSCERDQLKEKVQSLNDKLEMAYAIVDEKEAIIVEARQESKANKVFAEQKEEEVKVLEHSIEELESTINVLEKKVYEMDDEVERHRLIRESLEFELESLRHRLLTVENISEHLDSENSNAEDIQNLISRQLHNKDVNLHQAHTRIKFLEEEIAQQQNEIKQYKEYITELMLHADAQSSQYQQKYKSLEDMVHEVKLDPTNSTSTVQAMEKTEKSTARARGSGSPFRCISSLVPQVNLEREQELSAAKLRIDELEALAAGRQKEVCLLKTRLAAAESMTHDVIRELLGVKLDINNFADLIDQYQVKKLVEDAHRHTEAFMQKEEEVANLRKQINCLNEERESWMLEMNKREGALLAAEIDIEQLNERDRLLSTQNEMLKVDITNLKKRIAELDMMVKTLFGTKSSQEQPQQTSSSSSSKTSLKIGNVDPKKKLEQSEKFISRVNGELAQYYKSSRDGTPRHGSWSTSRRQKSQVG